MHFLRVFCKEYVIERVKQNMLDHIYDKVPKLLEQYEWYSLQKIFQFIQKIIVALYAMEFL